ncbi:DnaJ-domain-containing protein [Ophiobolus disseminans]|uniref:DnaJ-domain-containing protein n=1 Tax=Ophiobolus disseminans TaxID=1469910 RepID=A0A6A7ABC7_9PLEO|nr:DnaJ-domain-containing protein [Ophiobolus disseminans]
MATFDHYYYKALHHKRDPKSAWFYAVRKVIDECYEENHLVEDDAQEQQLVDNLYGLYEFHRDEGKNVQDAWAKVSKKLSKQIEHLKEESRVQQTRRKSRTWSTEHEAQTTRRATTDAYDNFEDMASAIPSRGSLYEEDMNRHNAARCGVKYDIRNSVQQPWMPDARERWLPDEFFCMPPMPAGFGAFQVPPSFFPEFEYPRRNDRYYSRGGDAFTRPPPPMPSGKGKYEFPDPIYPSDSRQEYHPRHEYRAGPNIETREPSFSEDWFPRGENREPQAPRRTPRRAETYEPKPSNGHHYRFSERTHSFSASNERRPRHETREPRSPSFRPTTWEDNHDPSSPKFGRRPRRSPSPPSPRSHPRRKTRDPSPSSSRPRPRHESRKSSSSSRPRPRRETHSPPPADHEHIDGQRPSTCFYELLGLTKSASPDEIKKAYRKMSLKHHPDRVVGDKTAATNKMAEINQANDVLSDPLARKHYDRTERYHTR